MPGLQALLQVDWLWQGWRRLKVAWEEDAVLDADEPGTSRKKII